MAGGRGGLGWLVLIAALAVPGFLFYNWWSRQKAEHDRSISLNVKSRLLGAGVFRAPPAGEKLVNPISKAPSAPRRAAAAPDGPAGGIAPTVASSVASASTLGTAARAALAGKTVSSAASPAPSSAAASPDASTGTVVLPRDPMISPYDILRIHEREAEREAREEALKEAAWEAAHRPKAVRRAVQEAPIGDSIQLQGIVARPDGRNMAMINDSTYREGDSFAVDGHSERVKILRISASQVIFQYKKHRFKKTVSAD
jgi:hypothetical protein